MHSWRRYHWTYVRNARSGSVFPKSSTKEHTSCSNRQVDVNHPNRRLAFGQTVGQTINQTVARRLARRLARQLAWKSAICIWSKHVARRSFLPQRVEQWHGLMPPCCSGPLAATEDRWAGNLSTHIKPPRIRALGQLRQTRFLLRSQWQGLQRWGTLRFWAQHGLQHPPSLRWAELSRKLYSHVTRASCQATGALISESTGQPALP